MKPIIFFLILLFQSNILLAKNNLWIKTNKHQTDFYISYVEDYKWQILHFAVRPGELQNLIERKVFQKKSDLQAYIEALNLKLSATNMDQFKFVNTEVKNVKLWDAT
ncbi:MAG: hypothetical protein KDD58_14390, partial [Bdellovibrionales bacterium]|nr:hypothetical protein [Bdellovibrionales bacterium]